jgi:hypothetical protein
MSTTMTSTYSASLRYTRLPLHPAVSACHRAPWSALAITPHGSPMGRRFPSHPWSALAITPRGSALAIAPPVVRLPSRPVVRLPSHPLWSACHHAPPWSTCHRAPRVPRLPSRPVGLHLPSRPPWSACRRAPRGPLAIVPMVRLPSHPWSACHRTRGPLAVAPRCHRALRSSKFLSHRGSQNTP